MSNREDNGIRVELWRAWHRTWGSRVMQGLAGAAALLLITTWFTIPLPSGAVHAELSRLRTANQVLTLALIVLAFLCAYRVLSVDLDEAFDSLSVRGGSHAFTFAAGRVLSPPRGAGPLPARGLRGGRGGRLLQGRPPPRAGSAAGRVSATRP